MCKHGILATEVTLCKPRPFSGRSVVSVDPCIAPLVQALNDAGIATLGSCCGHGHLPGSVLLEDGNELRILNFKQGRALDTLIGRDIHGERMATDVGQQKPL